VDCPAPEALRSGADPTDERRIVEFVEALRGRYQHGWTTDHDCP
jgi:hypothetical protein